jgi:hypothetical protein
MGGTFHAGKFPADALKGNAETFFPAQLSDDDIKASIAFLRTFKK